MIESVFALGAVTSLVLGIVALSLCPGDLRRRSFALGMLGFALESAAGLVLVTRTETPEERLLWIQIVEICGLLLVLPWLVFATALVRRHDRPLPRRLTLALGGGAALGVGVAAAMWYLPAFDVADVAGSFYATRIVSWGRLGVLLQLAGTVVVVAALEAALRAARREARWHIKYLVLGLGGLLLVRFYFLSQIALFNVVTASFLVTMAAALTIGNVVMAVSLVRSRLGVDMVVSRQAVYGSLTVGVLGLYLLAVGILGYVLNRMGIAEELFLGSIVTFVSALALAAALLSERVRWSVKRLVGRTVYRTKYDYRAEWMRFTKRLGSLVTTEDLAPQLLGAVVEVVGAKRGVLILKDARDERYRAVDAVAATRPKNMLRPEHPLLASLATRRSPFVVQQGDVERHFGAAVAGDFGDGSLIAPLHWRTELVGLLLLGPERTGAAYSVEDLDFLETVAEQAAGVVAAARMVENLAQARAFEAFHRVTSFVIHDVKNSISALSLLSQNALRHADDPEFQRDSARTLGQIVERMKGLLARMAAPSEAATLKFQTLNLAALVLETIMPLVDERRVTLVKELASLPPMRGDADALRRVVQNLVSNAVQSIEGRGTVTVKTFQDREHAVLVVTDTGCGMSETFVQKSLFSPFATTKKGGWGIGLYQSKGLVEAHGGTIDVASTEGEGTTFCIRLPLTTTA